MIKVIDTINLQSRVNAAQMPDSYLKEKYKFNDLGEACIKNTMLARIYLRLASGMETKRYPLNAYVGASDVSLQKDDNTTILIINMSADICINVDDKEVN